MKNLEELHAVTDKVLSGLTADDSLKQRILQTAVMSGKKETKRLFSPIPAFCGVIVLLLITVGVLNNLRPVDPASSVEMNVFSAGSVEISPSPDDSDSVLPAGVNSENIVSIELSAPGIVTSADKCAALADALAKCEICEEPVEKNSDRQLIIRCKDGTQYRFSVCEPCISNEKCWSCEEFFTLYSTFTAE